MLMCQAHVRVSLSLGTKKPVASAPPACLNIHLCHLSMDMITSGDSRHPLVVPRGLWRQGLSFKAAGLLLLLLELRQDPDAVMTVAGLGRFTAEGRDSIQSGLAELEQRGLLIRCQTRGAKGRLAGSSWLIDPTNQLGGQ